MRDRDRPSGIDEMRRRCPPDLACPAQRKACGIIRFTMKPGAPPAAFALNSLAAPAAGAANDFS